MSDEISMNVSPIFRKDGEKSIYVLFEDGDKKAEILLPEPGRDIKVLMNKGFSDEEAKGLVNYVENDRDNITAIAGKVTPLKAFMGSDQGV
ncbi:MAG: hypothetical protein K5669_09150 [Lachnospiraceae bacterium]|nr:hypothetical protein [Lachnospiraceae bacterium]